MVPMQLPSSFEGKHGHIRYSCKAVLDRPWKSDKEFRLAFTVIKTEDLNLLPLTLTIPAEQKIVRHFYCCCFKSKPFFMSASIPFSGYVPGQRIEMAVKMNNQSNADIEGTKVALERITQYISQSPRKKVKHETLVMREVFGIGVGANGFAEVKLEMSVPPISPTNLNSCRVLTTCYQLRVLAKVTGAHRNPHMTIPITIGTVPINAAVYSQMPAPNYDAIMNSSIPSTSHPTAPPAMMDLPPPSYEEATRIVPEMSAEGEADVSVFNPRYPVWNFMPSATPSPNVSPSKVPL